MTVDTKEIVTIIAYLIGVRKSTMEQSYPDNADTLKQLSENKEATVIRYLCKLRTALMRNFKRTDNAMRYELKNLHTLDYFDHENIKQLEKWGFCIIQANYRSDKYMIDITRLINENIDKCSGLFQDWVNWDYIRSLFFVPKYSKADVMQQEWRKYMDHIDYYPFQQYIYWKPENVGGILFSDRKFLKVIYGQHGDTFTDHSKYRDAAEETKNSIYSFIEQSEKTAIAVDCENSNPFKLYSVLKGLNPDELSKIEKITLYDDSNTTSGWDWLSQFTSIPVEHIEVERVIGHKSLVDVTMTTSICQDFYQNGITSFIIVSSDSDYWGMISRMPTTHFLVMYEYEKCSTAIKNALSEHGIYYCSIDDFCTAGVEELKKAALFSELEKYLPTLWGMNPMNLTQMLYQNTRVTATKKEMEIFCNKYVKTLQLKLNAEGNFTIVIQK